MDLRLAFGQRLPDWPAWRRGGGIAQRSDTDSVITWASDLDTRGFEHPCLVLGLTPHPLRIWFDGIPVHTWSDTGGFRSKVDFRSHAIPLGRPVSTAGSRGRLVVQVFPAGGAGRLPNLELEEAELASRRVWREDLLNYVLPGMVTATGLFLSVMFLLLYINIGRDRPERLWFSVTSALFALSHLNIVLADASIPALGVWAMARLSLCCAAISIAHFQLLQAGWDRLSRRLLPWSVGICLVVAASLLGAADHAVLEHRFWICSLVILTPSLAVNLALCWRNLQAKRTMAEAWVCLGLSGYAVGGTHDLVVYITGVLPETWWYPAGFLFLDFCMALAVSSDLADIWRQNRQRAADLEFALHGQQQAKDRAEAAVQARNRFLDHMAHAFRTPLQGLSGALDLGPGATLSAEVLRGLEHQLRSHLECINEVIDRIDLEADRLEIRSTSFSLPELVAVWRRNPVFEDRGDELLRREGVARLRGDRERIDRVVRILCERLASPGGETPLEGMVRIAAGELQVELRTTCEVHLRLQPAEDRIDLALALDLLSPLGGRLEIPGSTEVRICFPVELLPDEEPSSTRDEERPLVVLAEDDRVNARILSKLLDNAGCRVVHAPDGEAAFREVLEHRPRLVLMDVMMPVMDGLEAARRIRGEDGFASLPIVGVTAHGNRAECLASGMDDMLAKPVRAEQIRELVQRFCPAA